MVNKFIWIPLIFLIITALSVQMLNFQTPLSGEYSSTTNVNPDNTQANQYGSVYTVSFVVLATAGFVSLFVGMVVIGILLGLNIQVFGSTVQFTERAQKIIFNGLFYGGLWGLFSTLSTFGINGIGLFSIPLLGLFIYSILSLFYLLGINSEINK